MTRRVLLETVLIVLVAILVTSLMRGHNASTSVYVVAGSSLISNIIQDVAGDKVETRTLIPPGVCPALYDVKPGDIEALANSTALFIHNYQQNYENVVGAIEAADNPNLIITVLNVTGNWIVPAVQAEAVARIAEALSDIDPENAAYYQEKAAERAQAILAKGEEVEDRLSNAGLGNVTVICAEMQAGFITWAGFNITATFGRPEDLSPADMDQLITQANQAGVALIIDNLQSSTTTLGAAMEQDIEAIPVTISNFPGGLADTEIWEKAIDKNVDLLLGALNEWRAQHG